MTDELTLHARAIDTNPALSFTWWSHAARQMIETHGPICEQRSRLLRAHTNYVGIGKYRLKPKLPNRGCACEQTASMALSRKGLKAPGRKKSARHVATTP